MACHAPSRPATLLGLLLVTLVMTCDARRPPLRPDMQVTPSEPMDSGGWRPVIDSRISYEVRPQGASAPDHQADQTVDLVPPPQVLREVSKPVKKIKPTRKPNLKGGYAELSGSETRVTPSGYTLPPPEGPTRPMRFPDEKRRQAVRIQRPGHHHHYHLRPSGYVGSESTQQLRFRPSPHVSAGYENPYPGWLLQNEDPGLQQQQGYYNAESAGHVQVQQYPEPQVQQQQYPDAQLQLALAQQQPELAQQQYQPQQQVEIGGPIQASSYLPGSQQFFGNNAGLFNINPALQKDRRPVQDNLFLVPAATEPSVHENEVPQGPQVYLTTRGRPVRPIFDITTDVPKFQITQPTVPTYHQPENSELRPRRPRPPTGIQSQLESNRRPVNEEIENANPTISRPSEQARPEEGQYRPRHPRPPSTEPPSWSHPVQEADPNLRVRRPRPPQGQFQAEETATPETVRYRRPRPPVQELENPENVRVRRPRPPVQQQQQQQEQWRATTQEPENERPIQEPETQENVRPRRPRPPPPVQEEFEDDVEQPVFTMKHRRPVPVPETEQEEQEAPRVRRPKPQVEEQVEESVEEVKPVEAAAQEDVDETVNVRPRRPRPPEEEDRPRVRRPTDIIRRRRPRPPPVEEEEVEVKRRRPQRPPVFEEEEPQDRRPNRLTKPLPIEEVLSEEVPEVEIKPEEVIPEVIEIVTEAVTSPPETTPYPTPTPTTPAPQIPSIPPKRRRPLRPVEIEQEDPDVTENYPVQYRATSTPATPTTTLPPSTTLSIISSRLRQRLNSTRPRFSVGDYKDRLNRLSAFKKNNDDSTSAPPTGEDNSRVRQRNRESSRFNIRSTTTTEEPNVERTTFKPMSRYTRPGNKFYSRYRASTEEPGTTPANHDATRRTSTDIYAVKGRRPYPLKTRVTEDSENTDVETDTEVPLTSVAFSVSEITTATPAEEMVTTTEQEEEVKTESPTTSAPEPEATTDAEDFSPAKRVTDLTSSATAFKPLSYFSAVPADGKHASQLLSRFTMATEDPILPLQAFFPTFTSKPPASQQDDE